jgi:hypothetical protein
MKKIIIFCPANAATGGPELLHQLCYELRSMQYNACMLYTDYHADQYNSPVCESYKHYENPYVLQYKDSKNNICIIPETMTINFFKIKKGIKILWWLSVDNYIHSTYIIKHGGFFQHIGSVLAYHFKVATHKIYEITNTSVDYHLFQSYYAKNYCINLGIPKSKIYYLSDYINNSYMDKNGYVQKVKKDQVLYNPKKGIEFTTYLMQQAPFIHWIPIVDLSYDEARNLMQESKVYIDFGNHPGKDRLPREAAINGCCIITGKRGAAAYPQDVAIPEEFKFDDDPNKAQYIIHKIINTMNDYNTETTKFDSYRRKIYQEKDQFKKDAYAFFSAIV